MRFAVKIAEQTTRCADISCIDIAVNLPSDNIRVGNNTPPELISLLGKFGKRSFGIEHTSLLEGQQPAIVRLAGYIFQCKHTTFYAFSLPYH